MQDTQRLTLTVEETAKLLGIGRKQSYEGVATGDIPSIRIGRRILVPRVRWSKCWRRCSQRPADGAPHMRSPPTPGGGIEGAPKVSCGSEAKSCSDPAPENQAPSLGGNRLAAPQIVAREIFTTGRLAEFCTERELEKQTGYSAEDWPIYVVKELLDNALDAAEEVGTAPKIAIDIGADRITVTDNGPGIAPETVKRFLDLGSRTSGRARYVSPTRGAQGQALSTILAMPYALAPGSGKAVIIEAREVTHRISLRTHPLSGEPAFGHEVSDGSVKIGTRTTVEAGSEFLPLAAAYAIANPHLALALRWPDRSRLDQVAGV
jgi:excisionase family DNA binding protein